MKKGNPVGLVGLILALITLSALLPSCRQKPVISNQIIVTGIGMSAQEESIQLSIQAVEALKTSSSLSEQSENATTVYRAQGKSVAEALQAFLNETGRSTFILHNQILVLEEQLVYKKSIFETLDYFLRNPEGRSLVDVVVCRGDPADVLSVETGNDAIPAEYISQLVKEGARVGTASAARVLDIQRAAGGVCDVMIPLIDITGDMPRLDGTVLFRGGMAVGAIDETETTALLYVANRIETVLHTVEGVTFRASHVTTRLNIYPEKGGNTYTFSIGCRADMLESDRMLNSDEQERLIQMWENEVSTQVEAVLRKTVTEYGCDPLGLSRRTAKKQKDITQEKAAQTLPHGHFRVAIAIRLTESGLLKKGTSRE